MTRSSSVGQSDPRILRSGCMQDLECGAHEGLVSAWCRVRHVLAAVKEIIPYTLRGIQRFGGDCISPQWRVSPPVNGGLDHGRFMRE